MLTDNTSVDDQGNDGGQNTVEPSKDSTYITVNQITSHDYQGKITLALLQEKLQSINEQIVNMEWNTVETFKHILQILYKASHQAVSFSDVMKAYYKKLGIVINSYKINKDNISTLAWEGLGLLKGQTYLDAINDFCVHHRQTASQTIQNVINCSTVDYAFFATSEMHINVKDEFKAKIQITNNLGQLVGLSLTKDSSTTIKSLVLGDQMHLFLVEAKKRGLDPSLESMIPQAAVQVLAA
ncbi:hypothetical protein CVT25_005447 [Psilocybe cyanescens]|uniref:Uncharacterized protein n=1 Tax=Psilocybe cyanescens TaxID=93625 RepID=A0A409XC07_PSICY|nr:hypothetical protein CVT25_005447 [Psilocybe cyanescens]